MSKYLILSVLLTAQMAQATESRTNIIYGDDNRVDVSDLTDNKLKMLGQAVAGRVMNFSFSKDEVENKISFDDVVTLSSPHSAKVCSTERFANQPTVADCTGFLVGEDLLVTAGHCMMNPGQRVFNQTTRECDSFSWMFDYKAESDLNNVNADNIYGCANVIAGEFTEEVDYALIKLNRKVTDRMPLKLSQKAPVMGTKLFVMGHPSGLPLKYADGARVFESAEAYFSTNLDTFGGNSGSPVFNADTLEVEGILVRGDVDYVMAQVEDGSLCRKVNVCDSERENCQEEDPSILGEHVSFISYITKNL